MCNLKVLLKGAEGYGEEESYTRGYVELIKMCYRCLNIAITC